MADSRKHDVDIDMVGGRLHNVANPLDDLDAANKAYVDSIGGSVPYTTELDDVGAGVTYVGEADPGTATSDNAWRIKRITETGPDIVIAWADGVATFVKVWDDRTSYTYT